MKKYILPIKSFLLSSYFVFIGCNQLREQEHIKISAQQQRVDSAQTTLLQERLRLREMQDSFQIKVKKSIDLGLRKNQAEMIERSFLTYQKNLIALSKKNLESNYNYLSLLKDHFSTQTEHTNP